MPAAQPDPAAKPPRKSSKPKSSASVKKDDSLDTADLLTELRFLKGLVVGLQEEVMSLKEESKSSEKVSVRSEEIEIQREAEPDQTIDFNAIPDMKSLDGELASELDILQAAEQANEAVPGPEPVLEMAPPVYDDSAGPFEPFDPDSFVVDFTNALEDPVPIDWARWVEEEQKSEYENEASAQEIQEGLESLAASHMPLIETVLAFNAQNPPDFVVDTPFNKLAESLSVKFGDHGIQVHSPTAQVPQKTAHDIMAELVAEAVQGQAVTATENGFAPEPVIALDELFPQSMIEGADQDSVETSFEKPDPEVLAQIPALAAIRACLLPLSLEEGSVTCGIPKPIDYDAIKAFEEETGLKVAMRPMGLLEVVHGLREGYATKDEENFRASLLSGAAPPEPITWKERVLASIPFIKAKT